MFALPPWLLQAEYLAGSLIAVAAAAAAVLIALLVIALRAARERREEVRTREIMSLEMEERLGELAHLQSQMAGRMHAMGEILAGSQTQLAQTLGTRLDGVTHRLGESLEASTRHTSESLRHLHERLALIDAAQKNLSDLTSQVTSLREVLSNKQARGAFGQGRMEAIVRDGLPAGAYEFQLTLSTGVRPDCAVFMPDRRPLAIDAKFPLEAFTALRAAATDDERKRASQRLRQDIGRHLGDIAEKYLIPGETQDLALMFVPSESVYADLYDGFDDLFQKAYRLRVVMVSPSLLMLAVQVIQQIQKDARTREAAGLIQAEVARLMDDVSRLRERVVRLEKHFGQVNEDVRQILISADKIERRAGRIDELEFDADDGPAMRLDTRPEPAGMPMQRSERAAEPSVY